MKTIKFYEEQPYVTEIDASILAMEVFEGKQSVITDKTVFFPEGGGQVGDCGSLIVDNEVFSIVDTKEKEGIIYHILEDGVDAKNLNLHVRVGGKVRLTLDWKRRYSNMQQHTGEHILSGIAASKFGVENVGFSLTDEGVRVDYNKPLTKQQLMELEYEVNEAILKNAPVQIAVYQKEQAKTIAYRSKKEIACDIRIVTIVGYDCCACCTPHLKTTGEVMMLKIVQTESYKGGIRLHILCGFRLLAYLNVLQEQSKQICQSLSITIPGLASGVEQLKEKSLLQKEKLVSCERALVQARAQAILEDTVDYMEFVEDLSKTAFREYANQIVNRIQGCVYLFLNCGNEEYQYLIASKTVDVREIGKTLNVTFNGRGGGSKQMVQGNLNAKSEELTRYFHEKKFSVPEKSM